jgi:predicted transcriptional regulator
MNNIKDLIKNQTSSQIYKETLNNVSQEKVLKTIKTLTTAQKETLNALLSMECNCNTVEPSHEYLANKTRRWRSTVQVALNRLRDLGLISWVNQGHRKNNRYFISPVLFTPKVTKALKNLFPVLAFFFSMSQLQSKPIDNPSSMANRAPYNKEKNINNSLRYNEDNTTSFKPRNFKKLSNSEEIYGDARITMPELRPDEKPWYFRDNNSSLLHRWKEKNPHATFRLRPSSARLFMNKKKTLKGEGGYEHTTSKLQRGAKILAKPIVSLNKKEKLAEMKKFGTLSEKQRNRIQENAMNNLLPKAARYFNRIPLTLAGKIQLALYSNEAIEYARNKFNKYLPRAAAFEDLCDHAARYSIKHKIPLNYDAVCFLRKAHDIDDNESPIQKPSPRLEHQEYIPEKPKQEKELVYMHYFKLEEHMKDIGFELPNPYKSRYNKFLKEASEATGESIESLHNHFKETYEAQKVHSPGETNTPQPTTG